MEELKIEGIRNVFIFICDSLRWDFLPEDIKKLGVTFKTIASSLYTGSSVPSMVSGLYPPKHGVFTWVDKLPADKRGLLNLEGYNVSVWCETTWTQYPPDQSQLHDVLDNPPGISLDEIKPPFVFIEDDKGGHCPYGLPFGQYAGGGCPDFFAEFGKKPREELVEHYEKGIKQSADRFFKRIETLEKRGLIEETLIIFTSDHGELLGEYGGLVGHGEPACPELIYVPTVFIHSNFPKNITVNSGVLRHVDFYPTIVEGILNKEITYDSDGINILKYSKFPQYGFNFRKGGYIKSKFPLKDKIRYNALSFWERGGGYVWHEMSRFWTRLAIITKILLTNHPQFRYFKNFNMHKGIGYKMNAVKEVLTSFTNREVEYGHPKTAKGQAYKLLQDYLAKGIVEKLTGNSNQKALSKEEVEEIERRLRDLGYID